MRNLVAEHAPHRPRRVAGRVGAQRDEPAVCTRNSGYPIGQRPCEAVTVQAGQIAQEVHCGRTGQHLGEIPDAGHRIEDGVMTGQEAYGGLEIRFGPP